MRTRNESDLHIVKMHFEEGGDYESPMRNRDVNML